MSETFNTAPLYLQWALQAYQQHVNQSQNDYGKHYHYTEGPGTVPESHHESLPQYQRSKGYHELAGNVQNRRQRRLAKPNVGRHQTVPPEAPVETRSVACWTFQHGTEEPRWFISETKWPKQRRVHRGQPDDKTPIIFRGRTVTDMDRLAEGACVEPAEDAVYCKVCGGLVIVQEQHEASLLHQSRVRRDFSKEPLDALVEDMLGNPSAAVVNEEDGEGAGGGGREAVMNEEDGDGPGGGGREAVMNEEDGDGSGGGGREAVVNEEDGDGSGEGGKEAVVNEKDGDGSGGGREAVVSEEDGDGSGGGGVADGNS